MPPSSDNRDGVRGGSAPQEDRYPVRPVAAEVMEARYLVDWAWALGSPDKMRSDSALAESSPLVLCSSVLLGRGVAADGGFLCHPK
jgi:hypothetical protein